MVSKPRIQPALAVSDEEATLSSQSSVPVQNVDGYCLETLMLVKQILFPSQANSEVRQSCRLCEYLELVVCNDLLKLFT